MVDTRPFAHSAAALLAVLTLTGASAQVSAQTGAPTSSRQPQAVESVQAAQVRSQNAAETKRTFLQVLEQYPPGLGRILRLDPTLMTNQAYLSTYPLLASFIQQNPDVPRNPGYYLDRYDPNYSLPEPADPRREALRMWRDYIEFTGAALVFGIVVVGVVSIGKYLIEYRRWYRISKINTELHNKILDRFGNNEELLAYIESPAGRRLLEAAPLAAAAPPARPATAPFGRILLSVQIGVLLTAAAIGLLVVSDSAIDEVQQLLASMAILAFALGVGSIVSAVASWFLSRKLGLLPDGTATPSNPPL